MRRKDREVTDKAKIQEVIDKCTCCRLGFNDNGEVYIVPMLFGYDKDGDDYTFYFHSAHEGRKLNIIKENPNVGFEMETGVEIREAKYACGFTAAFQSIVGNGVIELVEDPQEKIHGLERIMHQSSGRSDWGFTERMVTIVTVFKLKVTKMSCKENK